jgi:hypothetical protein
LESSAAAEATKKGLEDMSEVVKRAITDEEAFAGLLPMADEEKATLEPMTDEFFVAATRFTKGATLEQHIKALDAAGCFPFGVELSATGARRSGVSRPRDHLLTTFFQVRRLFGIAILTCDGRLAHRIY